MDFMMMDQPARQTAMRGGLALIDHLSNTRFDKSFNECSAADQRKLLDEMAYPSTTHPDLAPAVAFFSSFRENLAADSIKTTGMSLTHLGFAVDTEEKESQLTYNRETVDLKAVNIRLLLQHGAARIPDQR